MSKARRQYISPGGIKYPPLFTSTASEYEVQLWVKAYIQFSEPTYTDEEAWSYASRVEGNGFKCLIDDSKMWNKYLDNWGPAVRVGLKFSQGAAWVVSRTTSHRSLTAFFSPHSEGISFDLWKTFSRCSTPCKASPGQGSPPSQANSPSEGIDTDRNPQVGSTTTTAMPKYGEERRRRGFQFLSS